jgi:hypothetical protein
MTALSANDWEVSLFYSGLTFIAPITPRSSPAGCGADWLASIIRDASGDVGVFCNLVHQHVPELTNDTEIFVQSPTLHERFLRIRGAIIHRVRCSENAACFLYSRLQTRLRRTQNSLAGRGADTSAGDAQSWDLGREVMIYKAPITAGAIDVTLAEHAVLVEELSSQDEALHSVLISKCALDVTRARGWLLDSNTPLLLKWEPALGFL